jgi:hypothetical protein
MLAQVHCIGERLDELLVGIAIQAARALAQLQQASFADGAVAEPNVLPLERHLAALRTLGRKAVGIIAFHCHLTASATAEFPSGHQP